jgi:ATP-dependent DNA ligase
VDSIQSPYIWPVETHIVDSKEEVKTYHDAWVSEGYEGAILRLYEGIYGQGQRSSALLKVKEFDEAEFNVTALERAQRHEDVVAVCNIEGKVFRAKLQGSAEDKEKIWEQCEDAWDVPKLLTVKYFGLTTDGLPRFPIGKGIRDYE